MALVKPSIVNPERSNPQFGQNYRVITWADVKVGDTCDPIELVQWSDRTVQVAGAFGVGGVGAIEGSNDGTNYATLTDSQGVLLSINAGARPIRLISELPRYLRPAVPSGDVNTSLTFTLVVRRSDR